MTRHLSSWVGLDHEAHLAVTASAEPVDAIDHLIPGLVRDEVASRLTAQDPTLWGQHAHERARTRLGWTSLHVSSRELLDRLEGVFVDARGDGLTRVVLAGMGGAALGAEVICGSAGVPLEVLDTSDPQAVRRAFAGDLASTVLVLASKSGDTVEVDAHRRAFIEACEQAGVDAWSHIVVVTDEGSALHRLALESGAREIFLADPTVSGSFSLLTAFGLVPAALAGVPVQELLDEAAAVADSLAEDDVANPALILAAALAGPRATVVLTDAGSGHVGLTVWIEHLLAESTGKAGVGLLPVVSEAPAPELHGADALECRLIGLDDEPEATHALVTVAGTLGAQVLLWQHATAIACRLLGVDPFDDPEIDASKALARALVDDASEPLAPAFVDDGIEVRASPDLLGDASTVPDALLMLEDAVGPGGYLAVVAYADEDSFPALPRLRRAVARRIDRAVTFGWGPQVLHTTGQLHKAGAPLGAYLQIVAPYSEDLAIPGRALTFGQLRDAQAAADAAALAARGRPVLTLTLTDPSQTARLTALMEG